MKSLSPAEEEISTLLNGIIKENKLGKECTVQSHVFPAIAMRIKPSNTECAPEARFQRFHDQDNIEELTGKDGLGPRAKEKIRRQIEAAEQAAFDKGYRQGISEGMEKGRETGKQEVTPIMQQFEKALGELELLRANLSNMAEKEAVDLSMAIARKIVGNEISVNKNVIGHVVREALGKVNGHENIRIKLNPLEYQTVKDSEAELKNITGCVEKISFVSDENIAPGGCLVETNVGDIDARIENQLKVVEEAFSLECKLH